MSLTMEEYELYKEFIESAVYFIKLGSKELEESGAPNSILTKNKETMAVLEKTLEILAPEGEKNA